MLKRGLYKEIGSGDLWWLLYELDGSATVQNQRTGKIQKLPLAMFDLFYTWHSAVA